MKMAHGNDDDNSSRSDEQIPEKQRKLTSDLSPEGTSQSTDDEAPAASDSEEQATNPNFRAKETDVEPLWDEVRICEEVKVVASTSQAGNLVLFLFSLVLA